MTDGEYREAAATNWTEFSRLLSKAAFASELMVLLIFLLGALTLSASALTYL